MLAQQDRLRLDFDQLGPEVTQAFEANGVVCVRNLLDAAEIEHLREWVEVAIANPSPRFADMKDRTYIVDGQLRLRFDGFRTFAFDSRVARAAAVIMGSGEVRMYNDSLFVKEPGAPEPTPWHQDLPYFRPDGPRTCSAWIALDPANAASGAMSYALGSHRWGKMFDPVVFDDTNSFHATGFDGPPPDPDADPERYPSVTFDLKAGDVVFHDLRTLHKAGPNTNKGVRRRVLALRMAGDGAVWVNRAFSTIDFKTDLADGDPFHGPHFPVLWPRAMALN